MLTSHVRLPFGGCLKPRVILVIALAVVFGWLFGHAARWFTDGLAVNAQLYFHAFRVSNVHSNWVWAPLRFLSAGVLQYSGLTSWAFVSGYLCRRVTSQPFSIAIGALVASTFSSIALTTTSVRIAQPRFFEGGGASILFPVAVTVLFVAVPACLGARAVRRVSMSTSTTALLSLIAIGLAWWNANELGDALTFGCVLPTGSGLHYCTPREGSWGLFSAAALTVVGALTLWDSQRRDRARPLQDSASMRRSLKVSHSTDLGRRLNGQGDPPRQWHGDDNR